jgi:hypothetical protein
MTSHNKPCRSGSSREPNSTAEPDTYALAEPVSVAIG